ncbi:PREDICTED: coagulation factor X isoform 1-like [Polistes dominula]|uniref:Coagulation factor X isoform 1-like n=1 Tax=Polistes dominula TaxID=743375 RepID=A0ABM1J6W7_POLDO|nr:PREDICTED: coagulation factor X isoform 1-like [Polistes dominula]
MNDNGSLLFYLQYDQRMPISMVVRESGYKIKLRIQILQSTNIAKVIISKLLIRNYAVEIAIMEIENPLVMLHWLVTACINDDLIESEFGVASRLSKTAKGSSSLVLQSATLPYVPLSQCKSSKNYVESENLIMMDKFCAGTSVCDGDSGEELVYRTGNLRVLRGIVSLSLGKILRAGTTICDNNSYSLYTNVSSHINWI